jgi:hypothetical protein
MMPRIWRKWQWRRLFLMALMGYGVFYLSGTKPEHIRPPHYSYSLGDDAYGSPGWDPISLWRQSSLVDILIPPRYQSDEWRYREIANQKATGLGAVAGRWSDDYYPAMPRMSTYLSNSPGDDERQVTRTLSVHLLVVDPVAAAEKIHALAASLGGYVATSNTGLGREGEHAASLTFRVPVSRLEEARTALRRLAVRVESERSEAADVTKDFVDRQSTLRNYRAEEVQYLSIMRRATAVKDILEVSGKLSDVRGRIEKLQGELQYLSQQVQLATVTAYVDTEMQAEVLGMRWRPWYRIKVAAHDAVEALGEYFSLMVAFLLRVPAILLWIVTVFAGAGAAWRLVRWLAGKFFPGFRTALSRMEGAAVSPPAPGK